MRLKYYLRGAGCGMLVSAILFAAFLTILDWGPKSPSSSSKAADDSKVLVGQTAADAEAEAEEKQRVEKDGENLADSTGKKKADSSKKPNTAQKPDDSKYEEKDPPKESSAEAKADVPDAAYDEEDGGTSAEDAAADEGDKVHFAIRDGEGSYTIASNLVRAGLLDDASGFDAYLSEHGYDHVLRTGEFDIEQGLEYEEIAKILTKR